MNIKYYDLTLDHKYLREQRKNVFEQMLTVEDACAKAAHEYYALEALYGNLPEEEYNAMEERLEDAWTEKDEECRKLQEIVDAMDEAQELLDKLYDLYEYLQEEAGIR